MMASKCNIVGKPSICATQMLENMIKNPRPTRAEVTDICTAILDGVDSCMLSGETAKGLYPIESVVMMRDAIIMAESVLRHETFFNELRYLIPKDAPVNEAICCAAVEVQHRNNAKAIILLSSSGLTARLCSKYRPHVPILMVTRNESVARSSNLYRGVYPLLYIASKDQAAEEWQESVKSRINWAIQQAIELEIAQPGDNLVIIQGYKDGFGHSNTVKLHKIS